MYPKRLFWDLPLQDFKNLYVNLGGFHKVLVHFAGETYFVLGSNGSACEQLEIDLHNHFARGVLEDVFVVAAGNPLGDVPGGLSQIRKRG